MKDAKTHRDPKWPFSGFAPGQYVIKCRRCEEQVFGTDKYAWHCLPCAIESASDDFASMRRMTVELRAENETLRKALSLLSTDRGERDG